MNKKILLAAIIICVVAFFVITLPANLDSEQQVKQGILSNVLISESGMITLSFSDGEEVVVTEDNLEDSQEMYEYMSGWIGEEIIVEYSYDYYSMANEIDSVSPAIL